MRANNLSKNSRNQINIYRTLDDNVPKVEAAPVRLKGKFFKGTKNDVKVKLNSCDDEDMEILQTNRQET